MDFKSISILKAKILETNRLQRLNIFERLGISGVLNKSTGGNVFLEHLFTNLSRYISLRLRQTILQQLVHILANKFTTSKQRMSRHTSIRFSAILQTLRLRLTPRFIMTPRKLGAQCLKLDCIFVLNIDLEMPIATLLTRFQLSNVVIRSQLVLNDVSRVVFLRQGKHPIAATIRSHHQSHPSHQFGHKNKIVVSHATVSKAALQVFKRHFCIPLTHVTERL